MISQSFAPLMFILIVCVVSTFLYQVGYLIAAPFFGGRLTRMQIGIGPKLGRLHLLRTEVEVRLFPIFGMADATYNQTRLNRTLFPICGPMFILVLSLLLSAAHLFCGRAIVGNSGATILLLPEGLQADLVSGDLIVEVDGRPIESANDLADQLKETPEAPLDLLLQRDGGLHSASWPLRPGDGEDLVGIEFGSRSLRSRERLLNALLGSPRHTLQTLVGMVACWVENQDRLRCRMFNSIDYDLWITPEQLWTMLIAYLCMYGLFNLMPYPGTVGHESLIALIGRQQAEHSPTKALLISLVVMCGLMLGAREVASQLSPSWARWSQIPTIWRY